MFFDISKGVELQAPPSPATLAATCAALPMATVYKQNVEKMWCAYVEIVQVTG